MEFLRAFWAEFWGPNSYYIAVPMAVVGTIALWFWWTDPRQVERRALRRAFRNAGSALPAPVGEPAFDGKQPTMTEEEAMAWVLRTRAELAAKSGSTPAPVPAPARPVVTPVPAAPLAVRPAVAAAQAAVAQLRAPFDYTPRGDLAAVPILHDGTQFHTIDLTRPEDTVIAGMKRHGKGNLLQLIALEVLHAGPARANLIVLDMKLGVDYSFVRQLDHSMLFVNDSALDDIPRDGSITDGLKRLKAEMHRRYGLMIQSGARNLPEHNARAEEKLPYLYVIADEVADFTAAQKDIAEELARVGGGAGLICFWATQRPEGGVLSLQIQGNATRRVVFRLAHFRDHYVSLRIPENTQPQYDLTAITMPGIAVLRIDGGQDHLGRVPTVSDTVRDKAVADLIERWPRADVPSWLAALPEDEAAPTDVFVDQVVAVLESLPESEWKKNTVFRRLWPNVATPGGRKLQKLSMVWSEALARVQEAEAA